MDDIQNPNDLYGSLRSEAVYKLLQDEDTLRDEDVLPDIQLLLENIPENTTPLEKVRWLYINLGKLFSYDFRVVNEPKYGYGKPLNIDEYVGRYQTCVQISYILDKVLNKIDGVTSHVIPRSLSESRGLFGEKHVANEVFVKDKEGNDLKLLMDLTLDLYLIQSDCRTLHFGFENDRTGTYDIIPQVENFEMDKKLGFIISPSDYTDADIAKAREVVKKASALSDDDKTKLDFKLMVIGTLIKKFAGYHEGKQYNNLLFSELLELPYREFNIYYREHGNVNLKTVYRIEPEDRWIIYSNRSGFISTDKSRLKEMLDNGWQTNSNTLLQILGENKKL